MFTPPTTVMAASEATACTTEVSRLHYLIDLVRGGSDPTRADYSRPQHATLKPEDSRDGVRLPGISAIFPAFSSVRSNSASAYPTPASIDTAFSPNGDSPIHASPYLSPEQHALSTYLEAVRRGFAFHRKCNRYAFTAYEDTHAGHLLNEFQASIVENRPLSDIKTCEVFSIGVIAATFNRVDIPAAVGDLFYRVASDHFGDWVLSQPLTAMRCCALLGLTNVFQKATISLLYFDLALALANGLWNSLGVEALDVSRTDHVEFQQVWRSVVFGRAWLQSTIGVCTTDDQLWLPPIANTGIEINTATQIQILLPIEIARITIIASRGMRVLAACTTPALLLPAVQTFSKEICGWYSELPPIANANALSQTPWDESRVCLAYVHVGHLGAVTLMFRRTLSIYKPKLGAQKHTLQPTERSQLATIFTDGVVAAKQSSRILYLFLGEQAGVRHCWAVIYIAFVSAAILLYSASQMQLHDYPESEWQLYLDLVDNDMEILAYCQELDPVASTLRDTLSQYMQFLRVPSRAPPKRKSTPSWARVAIKTQTEAAREEPRIQDLVDLLLTVPQGRAGPAQTSLDLLKLVCQPFNDGVAAGAGSSTATKGYEVPDVLGKLQQKAAPAPRDKWSSCATTAEVWMPFGWQQCQSSVVFSGKSSNLALTMAQEEMLRAGV